MVEERRVLRKEREETAKAAEAELKDPVWIKNRLKQYEPRVFYFDIVECLRKLAVAGLSAFLPPGSFEKIAYGVIVTTIFLVVTSRLQPYVNDTDDALAVVYQTALLLTLVLAFLLKGAASDGRSLEELAQFEQQVGKALLAFCAAPILLAVVMAVHDLGATRAVEARVRNAYTARRRRDQLRGPAAVDPRNLPVGPSEPLASARRTKAEAAVLEGPPPSGESFVEVHAEVSTRR